MFVVADVVGAVVDDAVVAVDADDEDAFFVAVVLLDADVTNFEYWARVVGFNSFWYDPIVANVWRVVMAIPPIDPVRNGTGVLIGRFCAIDEIELGTNIFVQTTQNNKIVTVLRNRK